MISVIDIKMGSLAITDRKDSILKTFVGSCVAICLYDTKQKMAGMAHVMLPKNKTHTPTKNPGKYADEAIEHMLKKIQNSEKNQIKAKMAGGAQIFTNENGSSEFDIGQRNITEIYNLLQNNNIELVAKDCGGTSGRNVTFDISTEIMTVTNKSKGEQKI